MDMQEKFIQFGAMGRAEQEINIAEKLNVGIMFKVCRVVI
jgi:hypothetical protein